MDPLEFVFYRGATETQLVWNPASGPTDNVEAPFGKFYIQLTHSHTCCTYVMYIKASAHTLKQTLICVKLRKHTQKHTQRQKPT